MKNFRKRTLLIFTLILVEMISIFLTYKSFNDQEVNMYTQKYEKNNMFAIYVPNASGDGWTLYSGTGYPEGTLNLNETKCYDINGNSLAASDVLSVDSNSNIKVKVTKTISCDLYFDVDNLDDDEECTESFETCCINPDSEICENFCTEYHQEECDNRKCYINPNWSDCCGDDTESDSCDYFFNYCQKEENKNNSECKCHLNPTWGNCCLESYESGSDEDNKICTTYCLIYSEDCDKDKEIYCQNNPNDMNVCFASECISSPSCSHCCGENSRYNSCKWFREENGADCGYEEPGEIQCPCGDWADSYSDCDIVCD